MFYTPEMYYLQMSYLLQDVKQNQMSWKRRFVWKQSPEPVQRVVIESVSFINVTLLAEVWRTLEKPHLHRAVDVTTDREYHLVRSVEHKVLRVECYFVTVYKFDFCSEHQFTQIYIQIPMKALKLSLHGP